MWRHDQQLSLQIGLQIDEVTFPSTSSSTNPVRKHHDSIIVILSHPERLRKALNARNVDSSIPLRWKQISWQDKVQCLAAHSPNATIPSYYSTSHSTPDIAGQGNAAQTFICRPITIPQSWKPFHQKSSILR
jgi:hypothetical protein